jgi:hypothetical protein
LLVVDTYLILRDSMVRCRVNWLQRRTSLCDGLFCQ